LIEKLNWRNG